jgi:putative tryptophan/tyrosine transport system substrate-binding protein
MERRTFIALISGGLLTGPLVVEAQQARKAWRVGFLAVGFRPAPGSPTSRDPFLHKLRELGYTEGRNVVLEFRYAEGRTERYPALAAELVNLNVDVLVAESTPAAMAAKQASGMVPIVMVSVGDPVGTELIDSLTRPGGNITGLSLLAPELSAKRLDLLKQALPRLSRVTVLWNSANEGMKLRFSEAQHVAPALGLTLQSVTVQRPEDFEVIFAAMSKDRLESLLVLADTVTMANSQHTIEFAARNRVPAIYEARAFVDGGGLMSYGIDFAEQYRRAATYVDRILKGAKPADLLVEQPTKFELVINLKTAKALGLTIPPSVLARADEVLQ